MTKNIVIYGGSFNPSTTAHLTIGRRLRDRLPVDEVWYLVSPQNPFKPANGMAPFADRVEMARMNVAGEARLTVQDIESAYARETGTGVIETGETMRRLRQDFPEARFILAMGADNFAHLHLWGAGGKDLCAAHPVVVIPRGDSDEAALSSPSAARFPRLTQAADLTANNGWFLFDGEANGISATYCRAALAAGQTPDCMRPDVARYAHDKRLYGPRPDF